MHLHTALLAEHSKAQAQRIADYIGNYPDRFGELMQLFLGDDYRTTQKAAWVVSHCAEKYPQLLKPHLGLLIHNLRKPKLHVAVKRNTVRVLQDVEIPDRFLGELADICFGYLADLKEAVAVKVFSMTILWNICQKEPDLANELKLLIEEQLPYSTAGFKSRGKKILKAIQKMEVERS